MVRRKLAKKDDISGDEAGGATTTNNSFGVFKDFDSTPRTCSNPPMPPPSETESNMWAQEQKDHDRAMRKHNDAMMRRFTFFGLILTGLTITISIWAVVDSGKNAEKTIAAQVQAMQLDERPYIRTEFDGMGEETLRQNGTSSQSGRWVYRRHSACPS